MLCDISPASIVPAGYAFLDQHNAAVIEVLANPLRVTKRSSKLAGKSPVNFCCEPSFFYRYFVIDALSDSLYWFAQTAFYQSPPVGPKYSWR